jgi:hypothetical protein
MRRILALAFILAAAVPSLATAKCIPTANGLINLEKIRVGDPDSTWIGCVNRSFDILSTSGVPVNSTSSWVREGRIDVSTLGATGANGIYVSSGMHIGAGDGLTVDYGVRAGSMSVSGGLTASSGTFTATGNSQFSLQTSSGIQVQAGTLKAAGPVQFMRTGNGNDGYSLVTSSGIDARDGRVNVKELVFPDGSHQMTAPSASSIGGSGTANFDAKFADSANLASGNLYETSTGTTHNLTFVHSRTSTVTVLGSANFEVMVASQDVFGVSIATFDANWLTFASSTPYRLVINITNRSASSSGFFLNFSTDTAGRGCDYTSSPGYGVTSTFYNTALGGSGNTATNYNGIPLYADGSESVQILTGQNTRSRHVEFETVEGSSVAWSVEARGISEYTSANTATWDIKGRYPPQGVGSPKPVTGICITSSTAYFTSAMTKTTLFDAHLELWRGPPHR